MKWLLKKMEHHQLIWEANLQSSKGVGFIKISFSKLYMLENMICIKCLITFSILNMVYWLKKYFHKQCFHKIYHMDNFFGGVQHFLSLWILFVWIYHIFRLVLLYHCILLIPLLFIRNFGPSFLTPAGGWSLHWTGF